VDDALTQASAWSQAGDTTAIATVVQTWGSAPRQAGARMAISASGRIAGSVSGGCVEGAVADAARSVIATGQPRLLEFHVANERAWEVGLACGGSLSVFVERVG
jgi:xanthine dehydrogenase accessory factor